MTDEKDFRRWVAWLRKRFKSCYPVRVLRVPQNKIPGHAGMCTADENRRFTIRIAQGMTWMETQETLFEEWAHVLRHHLWGVEGDEHDSIYGAIYNEIKVAWHDKKKD